MRRTILCNPKPFYHPNAYLPRISCVCGLGMAIMSPKIIKPLESTPSFIHAFLAHLNLNIIVEVFLIELSYGLSLNDIPAILHLRTEEVAL